MNCPYCREEAGSEAPLGGHFVTELASRIVIECPRDVDRFVGPAPEPLPPITIRNVE